MGVFHTAIAQSTAVAAGEAATSAHLNAEEASMQISLLRQDLHRYALVNEALWELVAERLSVTKEDLKAAITKVEMEHARLAQEGELCPHCNRPNRIYRSSCMYCETETGKSAV